MKVVVFEDDWNVHSVVEDSLRYGMFFLNELKPSTITGFELET